MLGVLSSAYTLLTLRASLSGTRKVVVNQCLEFEFCLHLAHTPSIAFRHKAGCRKPVLGVLSSAYTSLTLRASLSGTRRDVANQYLGFEFCLHLAHTPSIALRHKAGCRKPVLGVLSSAYTSLTLRAPLSGTRQDVANQCLEFAPPSVSWTRCFRSFVVTPCALRGPRQV